MNAPGEVRAPDALLERILELAGTGMVLVGGQALAFWAAYYRVPPPHAAITKDVDLLGTKADVVRLARGLGGTASFPHARERTLLAGQVKKELPGGDYVNIDVLLRVHGALTVRTIESTAVLAANAAGRFRVLHPLDVLQGRLENLHGLSEKRDEHGVAQLRLAIALVPAFIREIAAREQAGGAGSRPPRRSVVLRHLCRIEGLALSDAGRKVARRHDVHVADAIEPAGARDLQAFVARKLPQLLKLMSSQRRVELERGR